MKILENKSKEVGKVDCKIITNSSYPWMYVTWQYNAAGPPARGEVKFSTP